ncbi:MAG: Flp1 family type IVb pilin [Roseburia sp.]|nr:Flp1 family type IVb pilin [Roseburia sp.]
MFRFCDIMLLKARAAAKKFFTNERGDVNVVAIVVLIAVAVVLALLLKDQLKTLITDMIGKITNKAGTALD